MAIEYIERPPRIQPDLPVAEIPVPNPPEQGAATGQSLVSLLVPLITVVGFIFASGSGNIALILPMGLAMVATIGLTLYNGWKDRQTKAEKEKAYQNLLTELRQEMTRTHNTQRMFYHYNYPDVPTLFEIAARKENSRFGTRLWERRPTDRDFGVVRLGLGSRPSTVIYTAGKSQSPLEETPLWKDARKLATDSHIVTGAPITIPLRPFAEDENEKKGDLPDLFGPARPSLGIFGKTPTQTSDFARAVLAHFCTFHSPQDARVYVVGHPASHSSWEWAEWVPHCSVRGIGDIEDAGRPKQFDQLCFSAETGQVQAFWKRIKRELDQRQVRLRDTEDDEKKKGAGEVTLPFLLVVVDLLGEAPSNSPLAAVATEAVVATINQAGPTLGAAILFLANNPTQVPTDCCSMIEVASVGEKVVFRYTEIGLNTPRYIGEADLLNAADARQRFAAQVRRLEMVRPFGSDLPRSLDVLQMQSLLEGRRLATVDKLSFQENWARSLQPAHQEWLSAPIGVVSSRDVRHLIVSAKEGGDGVHGMIAGTTGSGKSELLLTLIAGLALKYDPRIINFVLVDFKGGAAFEPFKRLPHVVDILTNLQANAVERMFVAIQAVMEDRAALLARSGTKDLVEYRQKVIPRLGPDDPLPHTFPHLFIIVDEFAEMITQNPEYKLQFESVTRLGRAFGVSLLLATQRPAGVVSDQMRANMKFRICLRVETPEDSKELLGRPDAAFLPNLGGRGYIQVGNDILQAVQVARAGGDYSDDRTEVLRDVIWLDDESMPSDSGGDAPLYSALELAEVLGMKTGEKPGTLVDWMVGIAALRAQRDGVPVQTKPWPDPLPAHLALTDPIDARYLNTERTLGPDKTIVVNEVLDAWLNNVTDQDLWPAYDWKNPRPLRVDIGLVDNPYRAEQRLLTIDLSADALVAFGAAGRGKTTFLKTLLTAIATTRSPQTLHMYALDFGRGGLKALKALPHLGASIDASEPARVEQLFRMLRNFITERQQRLAQYTSLADHNARNPKEVLPEIVVAIDNFAEFKESYEGLIPELMALVRDGRSFGIYFVITANTPNDLSAKLYNLLTQRITFTQADPTLYSEIVGRGARNFDNVPGRGLIAIPVKDTPMPLELQVGVPGRPDVMGDADQYDVYQILAQRMEKIWFAQGGKRPAAELPRALTLLDMFRMLEAREVQTVGDLQLAEHWKRSMQTENQEWLRAPMGLINSKDIRALTFQAQADGVHGMIAGTTGSGKSELLQTMIASMAVKYDPRIVNFVLVDYKGGPTIEPFRKLPHVVDMATNLQGNAVERIFIALKAEMDRRSAILAKAGVADLVDYRKKVIPTLKPGSPFPNTFPHLFVIVDEFAEMIQTTPEYKLQFEQITRLGRSFGVTLILATQRPSGAVTDQMKANMKFRLSLRVETTDDSKEMLGRPDAATLPAIAGRGYLQVGGGPLTELQAAYSGGGYDEKKPDPTYQVPELLEALGNPADAPRSLLGWLVGATAAEAKRQKIPKQFKPWPDPLPNQLPLNQPIDATYLTQTGTSPTAVINPAVAAWLDPANRKPSWQPFDWKGPLPVAVPMGLIDNPYHAKQKLLTIDPSADPLIIFGAAGRGKSTFLKSLVISLAAQRSPAELHIIGLDFGRGGLKVLRNLPHVGGIVEGNEEERVERVFRMLHNIIDERQGKLQAYDSLTDYNSKNPQAAFPSVLVVIDNVSEFKETYEKYLLDLITLVRDGRSFGVYFVVTAGLFADVPLKLYNLLTQRITFTQADASDYTAIMGRGWTRFNDVPGRGLVIEMFETTPVPLEFQTAVPAAAGETDAYRDLVQRMAETWAELERQTPALKARRPKSVEPLANVVDLAGLLPARGAGPKTLAVPLGINDVDREPTLIEFGAKGPHWIVIGPPVTGKTTTIRSLVLALAHCYPPERVAMILVDPSDTARRFFSFGAGGTDTLDALPHVLATVSTAEELDQVVKRLKAEYDEQVIKRLKGKPGFTPVDNTQRSIFVIIDHYDDAESLNKTGVGLSGLSEVGKGQNLNLVLSGTLGIMRSSADDLRRRAEGSRYTLVLQDFETVRYMGVRANFPPTKELPPGRGYLLKAVQAALVQMAMPVVEGKGNLSAQDQLAQMIAGIRKQYPKRAAWSYSAADLTPVEAAIRGQAVAAGGAAAAAAVAATAATASAATSELAELMAMQKEMAQQMFGQQEAGDASDEEAKKKKKKA